MNKKDFRKLSKNQLIELLFEERNARIELEKKFQELERKLRFFDNPHTPSSKKLKKNTKEKDEEDNDENESDNKPRFPGKPLGGNGGGIKLSEPDNIEEHTLDISPVSGLPLGDPVSKRIQTVIDFPDKPILTTKHIVYQYKDPITGEIVEPEVQLPKGIYGPNIQSITCLLRNFTNSMGKISSFIRELGAESFCPATVLSICARFSNALSKKRTDIVKALRTLPYIHADETGIRKDGKNGYVWTICSELYSVFLAAKSRARSNIIKLLRNFKGVLITDGYGGYNYYRLRQRCWAHLLREFKEFAEKDKEIWWQYLRIKKLYEFMKELNKGPPDKRFIGMAKWQFNDVVQCLSSISSAKKLVTLMRNGKDDWFTALYYEGVPLENNRAERELRSLVLLRKMSGGYRTWKGKRWIDVVVSLLHTWKLQNKNMFQELKVVAQSF